MNTCLPAQTSLQWRYRIIFTLLLVVPVLMTACAASPQTKSGITAQEGESYEQGLPYATSVAYSNEELPAPTPVPSQGGVNAPGPGDSGQLAYTTVRMVIKDAQMELLVENTDTALAQVTQLAADQGGYIISNQTWYVDSYKHASLRLGVPVGTFEETMNILRRLGLQVLGETASGQDVSAQYQDLKSQLVNLEATAARVRSFLEQAQTVEESLRISSTLSELEGQIETVKGQMNFYRDRSAFSTITVNLTPDIPPAPSPTPTPTPTPLPGWNPGQTFGNATGALGTLTQTLVDSLIWIGVLGLPFLLFVLALLWIAKRIWKLVTSI